MSSTTVAELRKNQPWPANAKLWLIHEKQEPTITYYQLSPADKPK